MWALKSYTVVLCEVFIGFQISQHPVSQSLLLGKISTEEARLFQVLFLTPTPTREVPCGLGYRYRAQEGRFEPPS